MNVKESSVPSSTSGTFVFAHRGASALAPENSMEAFALAHELGADGIELDVQLTLDGIPVVLHDPFLWVHNGEHYLRRDPNEPGMTQRWVRDCLYAELADQRITHPNGRGALLARLEEVLAALSGRLWIDIELKAGAMYDARLARVVLDALRDHREKVLLSSFDHKILNEVFTRDPEIPLLAILHARPVDLPELMAQIPAVMASIDRPFMTLDDARRWQDDGLVVYMGGADVVDDLAELIDWPLAGLFLDDPRLVDAHYARGA